jgi:3',5'-cyclic-nucleotide phosphodiesterase
MDYAACNIVYVDRTAGEDRLLKKDDIFPAQVDGANISKDLNNSGHSELKENLKTLLGTFSEGETRSPL